MTEIWKDVVEYEGLYQVSNLGRVRSLNRIDRFGRLHIGIYLSLSVNQHGYVQVSLSKNGKVTKYEVHRLVALTFLTNPRGLRDVNHKDGDRTNNTESNLEWCNRSYNVNYSVDVFHNHSRNRVVKVYDHTGDEHTFGSMRKAEMFMGLPFHTLKLKPRGEWFTIKDYSVRVS